MLIQIAIYKKFCFKKKITLIKNFALEKFKKELQAC